MRDMLNEIEKKIMTMGELSMPNEVIKLFDYE